MSKLLLKQLIRESIFSKKISEAFPESDLRDEDEIAQRYVDIDSKEYTAKVGYLTRLVERIRDSWVDVFHKDMFDRDDYITITEYWADAKQNKLFFVPIELPSEDEIEQWFDQWRDKLDADWSLVNTKDDVTVEIKVSYVAVKRYLGVRSTYNKYR